MCIIQKGTCFLFILKEFKRYKCFITTHKGDIILQLNVDEELCVGCGACVRDCVKEVLAMENGRPAAVQKDACIGCLHCMAVCPTAALGAMGFSPESALPLPLQTPSDTQMEMLIKSRRSMRQYKSQAVEPKDLKRLLEITAYAPTGSNSDQVHLTIIHDSSTLRKFKDRLYKAIRERTHSLCGDLGRFKEMVLDWDKGKDTLFRNAPHMVVASAPADVTSPVTDCIIALSYFELQAAAMGIGTTWCGLVKIALSRIAPELLTDLEIPESHELGYVMLFGLPNIRYHRTVLKKSDRINYICF